METKVKRLELLKAVKLGQSVAKDGVFVLEVASPNKLTVYFSDGDRGLWKELDVECDKPWGDFLCVPRDLVESWLTAVSEDEVFISFSKNEMKLSSGSGTSRIRRKTYLLPQEPPKGGEYLFSIHPETLKSCHKYIIRSVGGKYEYGGVFQGVFVHWGEGKLNFVATDRVKLSSCVVDLVIRDVTNTEEGWFIVYGDHFSDMVSLFGGDEFVNFYFDNERRRVIARHGDLSFANVLVQGKFPDYQSFIKAERSEFFCLNRPEILTLLDSVTKFSENVMVIEWGESVVLKAENEELGECNFSMRPNWVSGENRAGTIGYNPTMLTALLRSCYGDRVVFEIDKDKSITLIRPEEIEGGIEVRHLLPPLRFE